MNVGEVVRTALAEIRGHKLRSALTLLGIILGTLSITVMTSFLDGIVGLVWKGFDQLGYDGVVYVVGREPRDLIERERFSRSKGLQPSDAVLLMERAQLVSAVAPVMIDEQLVRLGDVERNARVFGITEGYSVVRGRRVATGRFLTESDERSFARVCVLGHRLNRRLFGTNDPLGQTVRLAGRDFRVVGVGEKLGNLFVDDDDMIEEMEGLYIPLATLRKVFSGEEQPLAFLAVKTDDVTRLGQLEAEVNATLRLAHRGVEDFRVENIAEEILRARKDVTEQLRSWKIVLGSLAGISLLVGGIGLLSVMLISIGERLYEIGLRKAIGATDTEVFLQFLLEAIVLSLIGGMLGAASGIGVTLLAGSFIPSGLPVHLGGLLAAIGISVMLGLVYGIYPALKASRLSPVDSLRSAA